MASRINAEMSMGKTDILFTILIMQLKERNSFSLQRALHKCFFYSATSTIASPFSFT
jgi:hypothetical protein